MPANEQPNQLSRVITKEQFNEWLDWPMTKELIAHLQREENAWRTVLGAGAGIRDKDVLTAGVNAAVLNAKADAFRAMHEGVYNYEDVVAKDLQEAKSGEEEDLGTGYEDEEFQVGSSWASSAREAVRRGARNFDRTS